MQLILSDGDDSASWLSDAQVRTTLRRSPVVVYALAPAAPGFIATESLPVPTSTAPGTVPQRRPTTTFTYESVRSAGALDSGFLRDAARDTGGRGLYVDKPEATAAAFREVFEEFRQRYVVTYTPTSETKGWHPVSVTVTGRRGAVVFARSGYFKD